MQDEAFGLPCVENIDQFRSILWQFHGTLSGNLLSDFNQLFDSYGHQNINLFTNYCSVLSKLR